MREDKDNSAKWLIEHHGGTILHLSGIHGFTAWRTAHAERTHPTQLPDGLLEVSFPDQAAPVLFVVEVATYPERRAEEQAARDAALVWLDRGVVPEVVTLVLHPKGQFRLTGQWQLTSRRGLTRLGTAWTVIELWTLSAEDLLALNDVGAVPWVPLAQTALPPEELLRHCRERIEQQAKPEERRNLLTVTEVMASLRYNDSRLLALLGGQSMPWLSQIPYVQEYLREQAEKLAEERAEKLAEERAEKRSRDELQKAILAFLRGKFSDVPEDVAAKVQAIQDMEHLHRLISLAGSCATLDAFRAQLPSSTA
jgi:hypothetical protein